jgi:formyltetrahydrofolate deformylase
MSFAVVRFGRICTSSMRQQQQQSSSRDRLVLRCCHFSTSTGTATATPKQSSKPKQKLLATLRIHGPDSKGIVAQASSLLDQHGCDIVNSEQWTDRLERRFFQRIQFDYSGMIDMMEMSNNDNDQVQVDGHSHNNGQTQSENNHNRQLELQHALQETLFTPRELQGDWNWRLTPRRVAIMVSKYDHCLWELLLRYRANELINCDIVVVLSNHETLRHVAEETFGIPYHNVVFDDSDVDVSQSSEDKTAQREEAQLDLLLHKYKVDTLVLARYMQVLSPHFLEKFPSPNQIINIHHSFLPAFSGGRPYHRAHERGVKLLGATAHYTTTELDGGPIIDQDVIATSHRDDTIGKLLAKRRIIERTVLVKALQAHLDDRIIVYQNKCVVFHE